MTREIIRNQNISKTENYEELIPQIKALVEGERDLTANLANISAALKSSFNWWWVGFYLVKEDVLLVGPFQGPVACTRIDYGKGVCGSAWKRKETIIVEDVDTFDGHIACSSESRSEIVVPVIVGDKVRAVLDADSELLAHFDNTDKKYLEQLSMFIASLF